MTRLFVLALAALAATADARAVCRPRPKPSAVGPDGGAGAGANATTPVTPPGPGVSGNATVIPPPGGNATNGTSPDMGANGTTPDGANSTVPGANETTPDAGAGAGNNTAPIPGANGTTPDAGAGNNTAPIPGAGVNGTTPDNSTTPTPPAGGGNLAAPPPGTDTSKPWLPVDTNNLTLTANPTPQDIDGSSAIAKWMLDYHNIVRKQYGTDPLVWNATMAQEATAWTSKCNWDHEGSDNLARWSGTSEPVTSLMNLWTREWSETFSNGDAVNGKVLDTSHLTQMLWKDHTDIGCGWSTTCTEGSGTWTFLSCKFNWGGNNVQTIEEQVGRYIPS